MTNMTTKDYEKYLEEENRQLSKRNYRQAKVISGLFMAVIVISAFAVSLAVKITSIG